jgi:hypothetical protein
MKTLITLTASFALVTMIACKSERTQNYEAGNIEIIRVNPLQASEQVYLSEFADTIKYIKLQTTSDSFLGRIRMITIGSKYIYAVDTQQGAIFIFDKTGNYITKLHKHGKGPEEYTDFTGIFFNPDDEYIEIADHNKLLKYSVPCFELLEVRNLENVIYGTSMRKYEGAYYYATHQFDNLVDGESTNADVIIKDDGNTITLFDKTIELNGYYNIFFSEAFTINDKNELFVSLKFDNTFYQLLNREAVPVLKVDFGNYGLDNSIWSKPGNEQEKIIANLKNVASFPVLNINNSNILAFSYFFTKRNGRRLIYSYFRLNTINKVIHTKKIINDITDFPKYIHINNQDGGVNHESWYNDYLVSIILPFENIEDDSIFVEGIGTLTPEDNPVLVLMKLKD